MCKLLVREIPPYVFGNTPVYTSYLVGHESHSLGMCTIYTRARLFTILAWNGVKLAWSTGMDFYSSYLYEYDVPV